VVVWYSTGFTHVPRPEDYPVMPTESIGLKLAQVDFLLTIRPWMRLNRKLLPKLVMKVFINISGLNN